MIPIGLRARAAVYAGEAGPGYLPDHDVRALVKVDGNRVLIHKLISAKLS
jgi:hypothetical protein